MARIILILGGARSGKSRHGEQLALATGLSPVYIATACPFDDEMRARIASHQARRQGQGWHDVEAPVELARAVTAEAAPGRVLLVDCLTLWLTNLLMEKQDTAAMCRILIDAIMRAPGTIILVSSEVSLGIVPENVLARQFRDLAGGLHQGIAEEADMVLFMVAGLPMTVKSGRKANP